MHKLALMIGAALLASPALAHTGVAHTSGLAAGFTHPLLGADHLLAMLAVGLWSGFALPTRVWRGAAAFMLAMATGAAFGFAGGVLPAAEAGIAASVVAFGLLALAARPTQRRAVTAATLAVIALFASFHGYAHAAEASGAALPYAAGFLTATGALHLVGIALARTIASRLALQRAMGGAIVASGLLLAIA